MNSPVKGLVEKVVSCISAIFAKLPKENQFALVPLIRDAIEVTAIAELDLSSKERHYNYPARAQGANDDEHLGETIYRRKVQSIKMLETKEGVKCLVGVI